MLPVVGVPEGAKSPSKAQKKFNKLIAQLREQRQELGLWQACRREYQRRLADEYQPLALRLREKRIAMARLLDRAMQGGALGGRERRKLRAVLSGQLKDLLAESPDPDLVLLYDKYAEMGFEDERRQSLETLRKYAAETLGVDVGAYGGEESPDDFADWIEDQVDAAPRMPVRATAAGDGAVREIYRKLVSEIHPDREADPIEQAKKTGLMQRANRAYSAGDLLTLLELQLGSEQIDATRLAGLADERLRRYVRVLEEQSRALRDELARLVEPFALAGGRAAARGLTRNAVRRRLDSDIRDLQITLRNLDSDLMLYRDTRMLERSLRDHRLDIPNDFDPSAYDDPRNFAGRRGRR